MGLLIEIMRGGVPSLTGHPDPVSTPRHSVPGTTSAPLQGSRLGNGVGGTAVIGCDVFMFSSRHIPASLMAGGQRSAVHFQALHAVPS